MKPPCEWCGGPLYEDEEVMHERCYMEREAEWKAEHAKEARYGA